MRYPRYEDQLLDWLAGAPQHHGERGSAVSRCVPDFSCCVPTLLSPPAVRAAYVAGDKAARESMCEGFMKRVIVEHVAIPGLCRVGEGH